MISCYDPVGGANRYIGRKDFPNREPLDNENPLHEWVHEYKRRRVDLRALVIEVRLSPWLTTTKTEEVNDWMKGKSFSVPVKLSELTGPLTPTLEDYDVSEIYKASRVGVLA